MNQLESSAEWVDQSIADPQLGNWRVRRYGQRRTGLSVPIVLHMHGGAFVAGSLDTGVAVATALADAGAVVVSVDYPLAASQPFPAAVEVSYATLLWMQQNRRQLAGARARIFVAGEEAGGNLAAAVALMARDRRLELAGQILLSPMLDPCLGTESLRRAEAGPAGCRWADGWCQYLRNPAQADHPYATPGLSMRLAGLPPTLLFSAQDDPMRDETHNYAQRLMQAEVSVSEVILPSPTGWPGSFAKPAGSACQWRDTVREHLQQFLLAQQQ
jgi:acetyl esterase/lipase